MCQPVYGGVTHDFLKKIAKKGLFSRFFGEGGTFLGSRGQIKYRKKKVFEKIPTQKKVHFFEIFRGIVTTHTIKQKYRVPWLNKST